MARVLIADDHAVVRAGLRQLLGSDHAISEIGEAETGQQTLDRLRDGSWDLLILDITMPDRSGLDILKHVRSGFPDTRDPDPQRLPRAPVRASTCCAPARSGYLAKESAAEELMKAVHTILAGPSLRQRDAGGAAGVRHRRRRASKPMHAQLSEREFQIFCKLATGVAVSEIARELCLSVKTVSTYRSRVLEKMNFKTNADITSYALRNGLIQ